MCDKNKECQNPAKDCVDCPDMEEECLVLDRATGIYNVKRISGGASKDEQGKAEFVADLN